MGVVVGEMGCGNVGKHYEETKNECGYQIVKYGSFLCQGALYGVENGFSVAHKM